MKKLKLMILIINSIFIGSLLAQDDGLKAYQSGDFENARKYYESILYETNEDAAAQFGLGTSAFQQQDLQGAMEAFQRALETEDKGLQSKAYYNMANALASQQKNEEALAFYRKALELDPTDTDAKHNYEMIRYQQQQEQQQEQQGENDENQDQQQQDQEQQQQDQDGEKKNDQEQEKQDNPEQQDQEQQNNQEQQEQSQEEKEQQQQQAKEEQEKQQDLQNAQAILDALKKDEKVNQKRQMVKARSKKLEKDW